MDFEERVRRKRRQTIRALVAEVGMVLSIVAIVVVATLVAMGFSWDAMVRLSNLV